MPDVFCLLADSQNVELLSFAATELTIRVHGFKILDVIQFASVFFFFSSDFVHPFCQWLVPLAVFFVHTTGTP